MSGLKTTTVPNERNADTLPSTAMDEATALLMDIEGPEFVAEMKAQAEENNKILSLRRLALLQLRTKFLAINPDFRSFIESGTGSARGEITYKIAAREKVQSALVGNADDEALGKAVFEILATAARDGPLVRWQTEDAIKRNAPGLLGEFYQIIGHLIRSNEAAESALSKAFESFGDLRARGAAALTYGERINILFSALAMVRPREGAPLKVTRINDAWEKLTGEKLFVEAAADTAMDYRRFSEVFTELFEIMQDEWGWQPRDWLDIQGFLWIACDNSIALEVGRDRSTDTHESGKKSMPMCAVNLILYGPPGTGKTYATSAEAIRLCAEPVPDGRAELMATYQRLVAAGRIEFVTFHQSMSYEDFVEGRQPVTGSDEEKASSSAGFRLETIPGLFRRIAKRAGEAAEQESFVLIIDEINRANISKVFGELITLLEPDKRMGQPNALKVRLPYSNDEFSVPANLHILGTMNTADRSIALLDTALRRRFTFREMMPDPSALAAAAERSRVDLPGLLTTINGRIEYLYDREHQIGHAYFTGCASRDDVDEVIRHRVIPLLAEYFFEDWAKIAAVLGDLEPHDGPISGHFLKRSVLMAPPGLEDGDAAPRFRWEVRSEGEGFDYGRLTAA